MKQCRSKVVGAIGPGRPPELDAVDCLMIRRLVGMRGASLELVAAAFGISSGRVRQVVGIAGSSVEGARFE